MTQTHTSKALRVYEMVHSNGVIAIVCAVLTVTFLGLFLAWYTNKVACVRFWYGTKVVDVED